MTVKYEMNGTTLTVKPEEALDSLTSPVFEADVKEHLSGPRHIIVDMEKVTYVSSAGIRAFMTLSRDSAELGADMKLIHVNEHILSVFDLVGVRDIVTVE